MLRVTGGALVLMLSACGSPEPGAQAVAQPECVVVQAQDGAAPTRVAIRNLAMRLPEGERLWVPRLDGLVVAAQEGILVDLEEPRSFHIEVTGARVRLEMAVLARLANDALQDDPDAVIADLEFDIEGEQLRVRGRLPQAFGLPFDLLADVGVDPEGRLVLRVADLRIAGVGAQGFLGHLGLEVGDVVADWEGAGVRVRSDHLALDPLRYLPPPRMEGRITAVQVQPDALALSLGDPQQASPLPERAGNYLAFRGGQVGFGALTLSDVDLWVFDQSPRGPLELDLQDFHSQVLAGYSLPQPDGAVHLFVPGYAELGLRR